MLAPFDEPEGAPRLQTTVLEAPRSEWKVVHDLARDKHALVVLDDGGTYRIDAVDLTITMRGKERYSHHGGDYESVRGETYWVLEIRRDAWSVRTETRTVMTSDPERFQVHAELEAFEGDRRVHRQSWDREIPRKVV